MTTSRTGQFTVYVLGQATMDRIVSTNDDFKRRVGGKALNQAVAARRLGAEVELASVVGNDQYGRLIRRTLGAESVGSHFLITANAKHVRQFSSVVVAVHEGEHDDRAVQVFNADRLANFFASSVRHLESRRAPDIFLCTLEVPQVIYREIAGWLAEIKDAGENVLAVLNPAPAQYKPDPTDNPFDVIVPNLNEAEALLDRAIGDPASAAQEMRERLGIENVCVTLGSGGAAWAAAGRTGHQPNFPATVKDKVGASDSFIAALAIAFRLTNDFASSVQFAAVCAAASVSHVGGYAATPKLDDVAALLKPFAADPVWTAASTICSLLQAS